MKIQENKIHIDKNPENPNILRAKVYFYERARDAMYDLMASMAKVGKLQHLLVPAYVGWSPKEGSGIYDPILQLEQLGVKHSFYRISSGLKIDIEDLYSRFRRDPSVPKALLLVNYFGFPDPGVQEIVRAARKMGIIVIEDNAHGMYTYLRSGGIGADASFFSIHKMLPYEKGGCILIRNEELRKLPLCGIPPEDTPYKPWLYDLAEISRIRRANFNELLNILSSIDHDDLFSLLYDQLPDDVVPQSLPILIRKGDRFAIYERINAAGFGVVSLYHTLIKPLNDPDYANSLDLSSRILNLPVHQDIDTRLYQEMVALLLSCCRET